MKILCVNCVISEFGGVEIAAMNLASGLAERGHDVHFLAAKGHDSPLTPRGADRARLGKTAAARNFSFHYREFPRTSPLGEDHGALRKALWHLQDLAHPANERIFAEVLQALHPDLIILHNITAVGLNIWRTIARSKTPCIQVIHELGLICFNQARFRGGTQCAGLCIPCRLQKSYRFSLIDRSDNFAFVSPSKAVLNEIEHYAPLSNWRREVIANPNAFIVKPRNISDSAKPRFLYVGRLDPSKGVEMMLRAAAAAHGPAEFQLDVLGTGSLEVPLRAAYAGVPWLKFHGSVDQETVADMMSRASALLLPSIWLENAPVVAVHALFAGLPVLGSRVGGIPEHVVDGVTGRLLPPGDEAAWRNEIARVAANPQGLRAWSAASVEAAKRFDPEIALDAYERLIGEMTAGTPASV